MIDPPSNALLLTGGYDSSEPHWQIHQDGSLMFSIAYAGGSGGAMKKNNQTEATGLVVWRKDSPEANNFRPDGMCGFYIVEQVTRDACHVTWMKLTDRL